MLRLRNFAKHKLPLLLPELFHPRGPHNYRKRSWTTLPPTSRPTSVLLTHLTTALNILMHGQPSLSSRTPLHLTLSPVRPVACSPYICSFTFIRSFLTSAPISTVTVAKLVPLQRFRIILLPRS